MRVLVATDIAARGIDVDGISHVINYDFPPQPEDYVHRIGRTGRAQAIGDAISFVTHDDADNLRRLERFLGRGITRKKLEGFVANTPRRSAHTFTVGGQARATERRGETEGIAPPGRSVRSGLVSAARARKAAAAALSAGQQPMWASVTLTLHRAGGLA